LKKAGFQRVSIPFPHLLHGTQLFSKLKVFQLDGPCVTVPCGAMGFGFFGKPMVNNYPVILRILGFFNSSFSGKIHHPWLAPLISWVAINPASLVSEMGCF